jgi:heme/copper-type cytochrome/quinol oxidase subunit 2
MKAIITTCIVILIVVGICVLIAFESKRARQQRGLPPPQGFRGWLLVLAIVEVIRALATTWLSIQVSTNLTAFAMKAALALLLVDLFFQIFALVAMFRRRRYFRFAFLAQAAFTLVLGVLGALGASLQSGESTDLTYNQANFTGSMLMAIVWTIYVFKSERVRNTFIQPEPAAADIVKVF